MGSAAISPCTVVARAVDERSRFFEQAYCGGDAQSLVEGYFASDDHEPMALPPGGHPPVRGREALRALFAGMVVDVPSIRLETLALTASDVLASEVGRAFLTSADGTQTVGRYVVCWVNTDDGWRAKTDFFAEDGWVD